MFIKTNEQKLGLVKTVIFLLYAVLGSVFSAFVYLYNVSEKVNLLEKKISDLRSVCEYEIEKRLDQLELDVVMLKKQLTKTSNGLQHDRDSSKVNRR